MIVHQTYALIYNEKVENIFICEDYELANQLARAAYGDSAIAVDCLQYPCGIGDSYIDGIFYHTNENNENTPVEYIPTETQALDILKSEFDTMSEYMVELDYQTAMMSLGL